MTATIPALEMRCCGPVQERGTLKRGEPESLFVCLFVVLFFETGCCSVAQAGLELTAILLPQLPERWDYGRGHHVQLEPELFPSYPDVP